MTKRLVSTIVPARDADKLIEVAVAAGGMLAVRIIDLTCPVQMEPILVEPERFMRDLEDAALQSGSVSEEEIARLRRMR